MNSEEVNMLYALIKRFRLDWRHPKELERVVRRIERGRMKPQQARRWLRRIRPWVEEQTRCFNPFPPAPSQEELGHFQIEVGELAERPGVRAGIRLGEAGRSCHTIVAGTTGSGKTNILRRLIDGLDTLNRAGGVHSNPDP